MNKKEEEHLRILQPTGTPPSNGTGGAGGPPSGGAGGSGGGWTSPASSVSQQTSSNTMQVITLAQSTGALCLDGSNYVFLYSAGSGSGSTKFMFNWAGGGFCGFDGLSLLASCANRAGGQLGSSNGYSGHTTTTLPGPLGYFSNNQTENPNFWNWNKIAILYCDGLNHQGYVQNPVVYNGTNLYFRGYNNTFSTFEYARLNLNLFSATEVIISGYSAGGQATYIWTPFLQSYFPSTVKLMAMPDAGLFLDNINYSTNTYLFRYYQQTMTNFTTSPYLPIFANCPYALNATWMCVSPEYILPQIKIPIFIINSQDDYQAFISQDGITCVENGPKTCTSTDIANIANFRSHFLSVTTTVQSSNSQAGFWLRTCPEHVYQTTQAWYGNITVPNSALGVSSNLKDAINHWYNNQFSTSAYIDTLPWNKNPECNWSFSERLGLSILLSIFSALLLIL